MQRIGRGDGAPACAGCGSPESVAPSVHTYRGPYFCIRCCNYLDRAGRPETD